MLAEQCEKGMKAILGFAALEQKTTMHSQNQSYLIGYDTIACNKHRLEIKAESLENLWNLIKSCAFLTVCPFMIFPGGLASLSSN